MQRTGGLQEISTLILRDEGREILLFSSISYSSRTFPVASFCKPSIDRVVTAVSAIVVG